MRWIKFLGSLPFAIFLLVVLAATLIASTFAESFWGTPFAQDAIYTALWFDAVLFFIAVNLLCAAATRFPFKKKHVGFVVTHIGIVTLLFGAMLARTLGVEGQMQLFEGEGARQITVDGWILAAKGPEGTEKVRFGKKSRFPIRVAAPGAGELRVKRLSDGMRPVENWNEGPAGTNRAMHATLSSEMAGMKQDFWLVERKGGAAQIGPARFEMKTAAEEAGHAPHLRISRDGETWEIHLQPAPALPLAIGDLKLVELRYYPSAKVKDGSLVNAPDEIRFNPAVEFALEDAKGNREEHTKFFLFPHFSSLKGGRAADRFGIEAAIDAEAPEGPEEGAGPRGAFTVFPPAAPGGEWRWRSTGKNGVTEGVLKADEPVKTGWMDMQLTADRLLFSAVDDSRAEKTAKAESGFRAAEVEFPDGAVRWLFEGRPVEAAGLTAALAPASKPVPFALRLEDFRKTLYPGTSSPSSFESDVTLVDPEEGVSIKRTIKMNKPLDYAGWRIFQSSYMDDPEAGEGSVFTVAKNPGIRFIYSGAVVIFCGVILLFYLHPFFGGKES